MMKVKVSIQSELPSDRMKLCQQVVALYKLLYQATSEIIAVTHISNLFDIELSYFPDLEDYGGDGLRLVTYLEIPKDARVQSTFEYWSHHGVHVYAFMEE